MGCVGCPLYLHILTVMMPCARVAYSLAAGTVTGTQMMLAAATRAGFVPSLDHVGPGLAPHLSSEAAASMKTLFAAGGKSRTHEFAWRKTIV